MEAEKKNAIGQGADPLLRSFDQREPNFARRVFDSRKIARHFSRRRQHRHHAGMGELPRRFIVGKAVADALGEARDRFVVAGEKMPARPRAGASIALEVDLFFRGRERGAFARVEADHDDFVFLARIEFQFLRRLQNAVEHKRAKVRAFVIGEHEHDWFAAEKTAEQHGRAVLVAEDGIERNLRMKFLLKARARRDFFLRGLGNDVDRQDEEHGENESG